MKCCPNQISALNALAILVRPFEQSRSSLTCSCEAAAVADQNTAAHPEIQHQVNGFEERCYYQLQLRIKGLMNKHKLLVFDFLSKRFFNDNNVATIFYFLSAWHIGELKKKVSTFVSELVRELSSFRTKIKQTVLFPGWFRCRWTGWLLLPTGSLRQRYRWTSKRWKR